MEVFNGNFDKVDIEDLTPGLKKRILESSDLITYDLNRHIADKKMHISAVDRNNWDSKAPNDFYQLQRYASFYLQYDYLNHM